MLWGVLTPYSANLCSWMGVILPNNTVIWSGLEPRPSSSRTWRLLSVPKKFYLGLTCSHLQSRWLKSDIQKYQKTKHSGLVFELNVLQIAVVGKVTGSWIIRSKFQRPNHCAHASPTGKLFTLCSIINYIAVSIFTSQVDFGKIVKITRVFTQGRSDYDQWVTSYWISYSLNNGFYEVYGENGPIVSLTCRLCEPEPFAMVVEVIARDWPENIFNKWSNLVR